MTQPPIEPPRPEQPADDAGAVPSFPPAGAPLTPGATVLPGVGVGAAAGAGAESTAAPRKSRRGWIIGGVVGLTVAIIGAGGFAAYAFLSGGGAQPEDVVSADAVAFLKVDLDPAAGQKVNLARLAQSIDADADTSSIDDPRSGIADILSSVTGTDVDYDRDLKAWIGNRAAVAVLSGGGTSLEELATTTQPLVVIATNDEAAAQESLNRLYNDGTNQWTVATRDGFVLVGSASATAVPAATLGSTNGYIGTEDAVGDSLAFAYINVDRGLDLIEAASADLEGLLGDAQAAGAAGSDGLPSLEPGQLTEGLAKVRAELEQIPNRLGTRTLGIGLIAQPDGFDISVRALGLSKALPADEPLQISKNAIGAIGLQGYQDYVQQVFSEVPAEVKTEEVDTILAAVGERVAAQFGVDGQGTPVVRAVVGGEDPVAIQDAWQTLASSGAVPLEITNEGEQVVIGTPGASSVFTDTEGTAKVLSVLPDADEAAVYAYVDVKALSASGLGAGQEGAEAGLQNLSALGLSVAGEQAGDLSVRFAIRLN
jgi:hypothetical protein